MKLHLAPMEGVVDFVLRELLTEVGGIDFCVTEFIRVTDRILPDFVFYRMAPELKNNCQTKSKTPLIIQLLGSDPSVLADNALFAIQLGATAIDLNFGCPAKTVNRHRGGAVLLDEPDLIYNIISKIRSQIPSKIPLSAKIRLGFNETSKLLDNAKAIESAGAQKLVVHCRTKADFYKPPAKWEYLAKIKEVIKIPLVANGDIFSTNDFLACKNISACEEFMIGRGALMDPNLFNKIKSIESNQSEKNFHFDLKNYLLKFFDKNSCVTSPNFAQARTKQMLRYFSNNTEIKGFFDEIKVIQNPKLFYEKLNYLKIESIH